MLQACLLFWTPGTEFTRRKSLRKQKSASANLRYKCILKSKSQLNFWFRLRVRARIRSGLRTFCSNIMHCLQHRTKICSIQDRNGFASYYVPFWALKVNNKCIHCFISVPSYYAGSSRYWSRINMTYLASSPKATICSPWLAYGPPRRFSSRNKNTGHSRLQVSTTYVCKRDKEST